ncbi:hypothetical protein B0H14DRAFT_2589696 [Mycena olivaceomarginata]|nr:hypothetical protein B0H14DRAFT_2589696 [Mycena olivaceomarginata]
MERLKAGSRSRVVSRAIITSDNVSDNDPGADEDGPTSSTSDTSAVVVGDIISVYIGYMPKLCLFDGDSGHRHNTVGSHSTEGGNDGLMAIIAAGGARRYSAMVITSVILGDSGEPKSAIQALSEGVTRILNYASFHSFVLESQDVGSSGSQGWLKLATQLLFGMGALTVPEATRNANQAILSAQKMHKNPWKMPEHCTQNA